MWDIIISGGWIMAPILLCSVLALTIIVERSFTLRKSRIVSAEVVDLIVGHSLAKISDQASLDASRQDHPKLNSPLGQILLSALAKKEQGQAAMKEAIVDNAVQHIHNFEKYLNTLGSISTITPLLGLLGTVIGMIKVFSAIVIHGSGDTSILAGGISEALITTAAGLMVAIPSVFAHRALIRHIDNLSLAIEAEAQIFLTRIATSDKDAQE